MDGPVVTDAISALDRGDVTPVLRWVARHDEQAIRDVFAQTQIVRAGGPEARELADRYFFETLVRVHRASEGAPYTGLKPAGAEIEPGVSGADRALQSGSVDNLARMVSEAVAEGIRRRFSEALARQRVADDSIDNGRAYVAAYVEFVHYVEGIHRAVRGSAHSHQSSDAHEE